MDLVADPTWTWRADAFVDLSEGDELNRLRARPGEVVLVLERPPREVWLHTKDFYPPGTFRLPTGSLKQGEAPDDGYGRELYEETGIRPAPDPRRVAVIRYSGPGGRFPFASYVYRVVSVERQPAPVDDAERITGWRTIPWTDLGKVAASLRQFTDRWQAWGAFRAVVHDVLAEIQTTD